MADPTPQYVRDLSIVGHFALLTDGQIQNVIDRVVLLYKQLTPEDLYTPVVGLHTAHIIRSQQLAGGGAGGGGQGGQLVRAKVGQLEKQYAADKPAELGYGLDATTSYGRECERLLRSRLPAMRVGSPK